VHWLATAEATCVISAVFETFVMVTLWLQHGTLVRIDFKPTNLVISPSFKHSSKVSVCSVCQ
jgi:hypothetical protein